MHVLFMAPNFPVNQRFFVRALHQVGARVTGIGASSTPVVTTTWRPPAPPVVPPPREAKPCTVLACEQLSVPGVGGVDEDEELLELDVLELELLELVLELDELLEDELEEELDAGGQVAEPTLPRSRRRLSTMASSPLSTRSTKNEVGVPMLDVTL